MSSGPICTPSALRGERHVDAIIDDERNAERGERGLDRARRRDHRPGVALLVAQLHERRPALRDQAREFDQVAPAGTLRIDDGVQAQIERLYHGSSRRLPAGGPPCVERNGSAAGAIRNDERLGML